MFRSGVGCGCWWRTRVLPLLFGLEVGVLLMVKYSLFG